MRDGTVTGSVVIYDLTSMTISVNFDELDVDQLSEGMSVTVYRETSSETEVYEAEITYISLEASSSNGVATFAGEITIYSDGELSAGVNVSYYVDVGGATEGLLAPVSALRSYDDGYYLIVQAGSEPEETIEVDEEYPDGFYAVPVETGSSNEDYVVITSGAAEGDVVFLRYQQSAPSGGDETSSAAIRIPAEVRAASTSEAAACRTSAAEAAWEAASAACREADMLIEIHDLKKIYSEGEENEVRALDGVDLSVDYGEFVAIVGTSGSGKSTMMNILGCLDVPTYGEYLLDGIPVKERSERELAHIRSVKIGFIFQGYNLIPSLNVWQNVAFRCSIRECRSRAPAARHGRARAGGYSAESREPPNATFRRPAAARGNRPRHSDPLADNNGRRADRRA